MAGKKGDSLSNGNIGESRLDNVLVGHHIEYAGGVDESVLLRARSNHTEITAS